jgi:hypothetical protein
MKRVEDAILALSRSIPSLNLLQNRGSIRQAFMANRWRTSALRQYPVTGRTYRTSWKEELPEAASSSIYRKQLWIKQCLFRSLSLQVQVENLNITTIPSNSTNVSNKLEGGTPGSGLQFNLLKQLRIKQCLFRSLSLQVQAQSSPFSELR